MRLQPIPRKLINEAALYMGSELVKKAEGPLGDPATWHAVAQNEGIKVYEFHAPGAGRGEFVVGTPDGHPARIAINTAYPAREVASAYVHELSEILLRRMQPPLLPSEADAGRYEGEPDDVQHLISRKTEKVVLG